MSLRLEGLRLCVDVLELRIAVGVVGAFQCLACALEAVVQPTQQVAYHASADAVSALPQRAGQLDQAFARPPQRRLWIPSGDRVHQRLQVGEQRRVLTHEARAPATMPAYPRRGGGRLRRSQLDNVPPQRAPCEARHPGHQRHAPVAQRLRLCRRDHPPRPLIQQCSHGAKHPLQMCLCPRLFHHPPIDSHPCPHRNHLIPLFRHAA